MQDILQWLLFKEVKVFVILDKFLLNKLESEIDLFLFNFIVDRGTLVQAVHW